MPTRSYLSQSELPVTIGLGSETQVELLETRWPDGSVQKIEPVLNKELRITQPEPQASSAPLQAAAAR
jgi:hypothetical protein